MNIFNKPINEIIKSRHSVRTYENNELPKDVLNKVKTYIDEINNSNGRQKLEKITTTVKSLCKQDLWLICRRDPIFVGM